MQAVKYRRRLVIGADGQLRITFVRDRWDYLKSNLIPLCVLGGVIGLTIGATILAIMGQ